MNYAELICKIIDLSHSTNFSDTLTERGLRNFEQLDAPYFGICEVSKGNESALSTWAIYRGGYKTPLTKIIAIGTEEEGIFEKFVTAFALNEAEYSLYNRRRNVAQ